MYGMACRYFTAELLPEEDAAQPPSTTLAPDTAGTGTGIGTGTDADAGGPTAPGWSDRPLKTAPPGVRPGVLSKALAAALGLASPLDPPPWLTAMALYGLPPSYCDSVRVAAAVAAAERAAGRGGGAAGIRVYGADGEALPMPGDQAEEDEDVEEQEEEVAEAEAPSGAAAREQGEQVREAARLSAAATVAVTAAAAAAVAVAEAAMAGDVAEPQAAADEVGQAHGGAVMDVASEPAGGSDGSVGAGPSGEMSRGERCSLRAALEALVCTGALAALGDALLGTHTASAADAGATSNGNGVSGGGAASMQQMQEHGSSDGATGPARAEGATCDNPRDHDAAEAGAPPLPSPSQAGQPAEQPAVGQGASNEAEPDREDLAAPPSPGPPPPPLEPVDMLLPSEPRLVLFPGLNAPPPGAVRMRVKAAWARALANAQRVQAAVAAAVGPLVPRRPIAGEQDAAEHPMEEGWRGRDAGGREAAEGAGAEGESRAAKRGRWGPPGPAAAARAGVSRDGGGVGSAGGSSSGQQPGSHAASDPGAPHGDAGAQGPAPHQHAHGVLHHSLQHQHSQDWRHSQGKPPQQQQQQQQSNHSHQQEQQQRGHSQGPQYSAGHVPLQVQGPAHGPPPPQEQQPQDVSRQGGMQGGSMGLGNGGLVNQQSPQQQQQQQQHLTPQQQASFALQQQQFDAMLQQQRQQQMQLQQQQQHMLQQQMQHQQQQYLFQQMVMQQQQGMAGQPYFGGGVGALFMQQEQGPGMFVFRGMR